ASGTPCKPTGQEPIALWQQYAKRARLLLKVAAHLTRGEIFRPATWFQEENPNEEIPTTEFLRGWYGVTLDRQRHRLAMLVNEWLWLGDVRPVLVWNKDACAMQLNFGSPYYGLIFGALGIELMLAISRQGDFATCSGCGQPYVRAKRRPKAG